MEPLDELVARARQGDVAAYGRLVQATERMVFGVALRVLRDEALAQDATQETYLRAFRRVGGLEEDAAFLTWLRRIAATVAINMRRARRTTFLRLDEGVDVPILDEMEARWSEMAEQSEIRTGQSPRDLPGRIVELLSRPQLTNLPDNPVGQVTRILTQ